MDFDELMVFFVMRNFYAPEIFYSKLRERKMNAKYIERLYSYTFRKGVYPVYTDRRASAKKDLIGVWP